MKDEKGPGYSQTDNKTLEKLARCKIFSHSARILFVIIRLVNGYLETLRDLRVSVIAERTGIEEANVRRSLRELIADKIIVRNGNLTGIIGAVVYLKEGGLYSTPSKRSDITYKGVKYDIKGGSDLTPYKERTKENLLKKGGIASQLSRKEIDKLEGKPWLRATMIYEKIWDIKFIDEVLSKHEFMKLYDCWDALQMAGNVRDTKAWYLAKLDSWRPER